MVFSIRLIKLQSTRKKIPPVFRVESFLLFETDNHLSFPASIVSFEMKRIYSAVVAGRIAVIGLHFTQERAER